MATKLKAVSALLFVSGATSLIYEVVWGKWLASVLGNSGQAHSVVLAVFMGGLALGAWLFGGLADRAKAPLKLYALLEGGIAAYALAFPYALKALSAVYLALGGGLFGKLFFAGLAVLPPTLLMGGTLLPVVRHVSAHVSTLRPNLAVLYAVNALGAAFGALLGGMVLLPMLGLSKATWAAAGLNLWVAGAAAALAHKVPPATKPEAAPSDEPEYGPRAVLAARVGALLSGFASMALQVAWIRAFTLVLGASTYAFTLIVATFVLGIGLGSLVLTRVRTKDALFVFGATQLFLALAVAATLPLYSRLPFWLWQLSSSIERVPANWPVLQALSFALCALVLLGPTTLLGAGFPAAARVGAAQEQALGRRVGAVYLWNTAGAVSGALFCGLWWMPQTSMAGCVALALGACVVGGAFSLATAPTLVSRRIPMAVAVAATALVTGLTFLSASDWPAVLASAGTFRERKPPTYDFEGFKKETLGEVELLRRDDTFATVVVSFNPQSGLNFLRVNGKIDATGDEGMNPDMTTQVLLGQLGPMLHQGPVKTALVIGLGSGVTVGSLLTHDSIEQIDVVEISPAVIEGAQFFAKANRNALDDPRVKVHVDDARTFLLLGNKTYDVIVSEPSNPWVAGVAGLYTREFFQLAKKHLQPGGLLVQWQHLYETERKLVELIVRTMRETFPYSTSWLGGLDLLMVASAEPHTPDFALMQSRLQSWTVGGDLGRARAHTLAGFLALQVHSDEGMKELAGTGPINTEDMNLLEFEAPRAFYLASGRVKPDDERGDPKRGGRLAIAAWKRDHVLTPIEAANIHTARLLGGAIDEAGVAEAANEWLSAAPNDLLAKEAVAATALGQNNARLALELMTEVVRAAPPTLQTARFYSMALMKLGGASGAPPQGDPPALSVIRLAMEGAGTTTPDLENAILYFCNGTERVACLQAAPPLEYPEDEAQ